MAKKAVKKVEKKERKKREHPLFDYSYVEEVTFECPTRGIVTQKVTVKRYKSQQQAAREAVLRSQNDEFEELLESNGYLIEGDDTEVEDSEID